MLPEHWMEGDVDVRGKRLHYYRSGKGGKPSLVLAHGFSDYGLCWQKTGLDLQDTYDVLMPDAVAHGHSARLTPGQQIDAPADLAGIMEALKLPRAVVGGHSMGAGVASQLAARFPALVKALILEDPPWFEPKEGEQGTPITAQESPMAKWMKSLQPLPMDEVIAQCHAEHPDWDEITLRTWAEGKKMLDLNIFGTQGPQWEGWQDVVHKIACPTLLITADVDKGGIIGPELAKKVTGMNPRIRVAHIARVGHHIRFGKYAEYMAAVNAFLKEVA
jgi:N-formylmaleamate deformylase